MSSKVNPEADEGRQADGQKRDHAQRIEPQRGVVEEGEDGPYPPARHHATEEGVDRLDHGALANVSKESVEGPPAGGCARLLQMVIGILLRNSFSAPWK